MRVRSVVAFAGAGFSAWLLTFAHECYYRGWGRSSKPHRHDSSPPFPGASLENVFWLLQISDIHVSRFNDMAVLGDFEYFCSETVQLVRPALVLVTGEPAENGGSSKTAPN